MPFSPAGMVAPPWWDLSPHRLLAALLPIALLVLAARPDTDPDLWWHMRTGQWIVENGAVPHADPFSFTMTGAHWIAHEWLADIGLFALYQAGGFGALTLVTAIVITATFVLVYRLSALRPHLAIFSTILAALASAVTWGPRPQMLTLLFSAVCLVILESGRQRARRLWLLPPLLLVWANVHSGFFLGLVMMGAVLAGEVVERLLRKWPIVVQAPVPPPARDYVPALAVALAVSIGAAIVNPNGLELLVYPFFTLTSKAMQTYIVEWHSPDFHDPRFLPFAALLLTLLLAVSLAGKRPPAKDLLLLSGLGFEALVSLRNIPLFAIVAAPVLTRQAAHLLQTRMRAGTAGEPARQATLMPRSILVLNWTLFASVTCVALLRVGMVVSAEAPIAKEFPVAAADYLLSARPPGPMLNSYNFGGYLIWRLYPIYPVFIDGRADVYGDAFMDEYYARVWQGRGDWQAYLDRFNIRLVVVEKEGTLAALLRTQPQWKLAHEDSLAAVFQRMP
jgi:hypothetical protein